MMKILLIVLLTCLPLTWTSSPSEESCSINDIFPCDSGKESCLKRSYGKNRIVCVCNSTDCDSLGPIERPTEGSIVVYESNEEGLRFRKNYIVNGVSSKEAAKHFTLQRLTIKVKRDDKHQKIFGFGGAFTDSTGINALSLDGSLSQHIIDDYFGPNGVSYSVARVPVGGSDFSAREYSYDDDHPDDFNLTHFALTEEDFKYKIPLIKKALANNGDIKLFASAWAPPAWMKTSESISKRGFLKGKPGGPYYKTWAKYYARFFQEYEAQGLNFWGMTTGNEPISALLHSSFNGLGFSAGTQRDFIKKDLAPVLAEAGYPLKEKINLLIFDDQLILAPFWIGKILGDKEAVKHVTGVAFHWYANALTPRSLINLLNKFYPDQLWLSSEACEGFRLILDPHKVYLGDWDRGQTYADDIITDINHGTHGWIDWNMALDLDGGPNWAGNNVDAPIIVNATANEYYRQPTYYAMAHIAKFLEPGSVRLGTKGSHSGVEYSAFETPKGDIVVVVVNRNQYPIDVKITGSYSSEIKWQLTAKSFTTFIGRMP